MADVAGWGSVLVTFGLIQGALYLRPRPTAHIDHIGRFGVGTGYTGAHPPFSANSEGIGKTEQSTRPVVPVRDDVCRDIARWGEAYNPFKDPQQARNVDASPKPAESGGEGRRDRVAPPQATVAVQGVAVQRRDRASGSFPESPQHQTSSYMAIRAKLVPTRAIASTPLATCQPALSMIPLKASHAHSSRVAYGKRVGRRLTSSQSSTWKLGNRDVEHTNARSEHEPS